MDELKRLGREATESLVRYVKLNEEYKNRLPKLDQPWMISLEKLPELDELGKRVDKARAEWHEKLRKYIEYRQRNK